MSTCDADFTLQPFNANNVDASVCANSIFGLTLGAVTFSDSATWFNSDLQQVYLDTVKLVAWYVIHTHLYYQPKKKKRYLYACYLEYI